ncbi:Transposon Tf2-7 polyprotein [Rhizoctonia solani]|uniref:Transposon Tf2-7 polyprotein n=1 Tax=Rhizoctonia solani TaxID=456999 RepID=A0A8H8SY31_9AGAM|nr:Transposon Tf2-7 polyprotein [Rhizoctonia solani]QRW22119.1 Transposon Tf2-7 polyprotein [Rhizoctonia solani]
MNPSNVPANVPEANHIANTLAHEWKEAESALRMTKEKMAGTRDPKHLGPFKIIEKISSHVYCLELLETLKIHNVFYIGLLSKSHESPSRPFPD